MRRKKRSAKYLILSLIFLAISIYIILFFPPTHQFQIFNFKFPISDIFLLIFFVFSFSISNFFLKNRAQGLLIGFFVLSFLIFRLNNLTHPFFLILLIALFLTLELLLISRKQ